MVSVTINPLSEYVISHLFLSSLQLWPLNLKVLISMGRTLPLGNREVLLKYKP